MLSKPLLFLTLLLTPAVVALAAEPAKSPGWTQKQFIITFWCPPATSDQALAAVAAEHYNMTWSPVEGLDVVAKHNLRAMLLSDLLNPAVLDDPARRAKLDALIEKVKNHPALEAYFITDEPPIDKLSGYSKMAAYLRQRDPAHLAFINLCPSYAREVELGVNADSAKLAKTGCPENWAGVSPNDRTVLAYREYLKQFIEIAKPELLSYDHYHFWKDHDGREYFLNLAMVRDAAQEAGIPFMNIIQACLLGNDWRLPNAAETRFLAFTTMAYGARGIAYFNYWGPEAMPGLYRNEKPTPMAQEVAAINAEISRFGPALMKLDSTAVYHAAPLPLGTQAAPADAPVRFADQGEFVLGLFGTKGRTGPTSAFMIVNRRYQQEAEATLWVDLPGNRLEELDRTNGRWQAGPRLEPGELTTIRLAPGDGRLFRIPE